MVGSLEDAAEVVQLFRNGREFDIILSEYGTTRRVFMMNGVVYKINRYPAWQFGGVDCNTLEYDNVAKVAGNLPDGFALPETSLFEVDGEPVIAMEYIDGIAMSSCYCDEFNEPHTEQCLPPDIAYIVENLTGDSSGMNTIREDRTGIYYLIDLG